MRVIILDASGGMNATNTLLLLHCDENNKILVVRTIAKEDLLLRSITRILQNPKMLICQIARRIGVVGEIHSPSTRLSIFACRVAFGRDS